MSMSNVNHANEDSRMDETFKAIANTSSSRLMFAYAQLVKASDGQTIQVPIVLEEGTPRERNLTIGQGVERGLTFKYIAEVLGNRIDQS